MATIVVAILFFANKKQQRETDVGLSLFIFQRSLLGVLRLSQEYVTGSA